MEHWVWIIGQLGAVRWKWIRKPKQQSWSEPLYTNAKLTVLDSYLLSVLPQAFSFKESVFWAYIACICPPARNDVTESSQVFVPSETIFVTQFSDLIASPEGYCSKCHFLYESDEDDCPHPLFGDVCKSKSNLLGIKKMSFRTSMMGVNTNGMLLLSCSQLMCHSEYRWS